MHCGELSWVAGPRIPLAADSLTSPASTVSQPSESPASPPDASPGQAVVIRTPFPAIRTVGPFAAFGWLARGLRDIRRAPAASLAYGIVFALMGALIALVFRNAYELTSALTAGFLLRRTVPRHGPLRHQSPA